MHRITIDVPTSVLARVLSVLEDQPGIRVVIETIPERLPKPEPVRTTKRIERFFHPSGQTVRDFVLQLLETGQCTRADITSAVQREGWHTHSASAAISALARDGLVRERTHQRDITRQIWELAS